MDATIHARTSSVAGRCGLVDQNPDAAAGGESESDPTAASTSARKECNRLLDELQASARALTDTAERNAGELMRARAEIATLRVRADEADARVAELIQDLAKLKVGHQDEVDALRSELQAQREASAQAEAELNKELDDLIQRQTAVFHSLLALDRYVLSDAMNTRTNVLTTC